jgi:hypothetical protein
MVFDKEKLLHIYDETKDLKPRKNPPVTDYGLTGGQPKDAGTPNAHTKL